MSLVIDVGKAGEGGRRKSKEEEEVPRLVGRRILC